MSNRPEIEALVRESLDLYGIDSDKVDEIFLKSWGFDENDVYQVVATVKMKPEISTINVEFTWPKDNK